MGKPQSKGVGESDFSLQPWHRSLRKQQSQAPKFFFFDLGVKRALERMLEFPLAPRTYGYGTAFEHFLIAEIRRLADYAGRDWRLFHLRTNHGAEIDLVIDRPGAPTLFIEIKGCEGDFPTQGRKSEPEFLRLED